MNNGRYGIYGGKYVPEILMNALEELESERINWTKFIGKIKEATIVLGALGSFASGTTGIFDAQSKLDQTTTIIQQTSININYDVIGKTFNIQNVKSIGLPKILELSEFQEETTVDPF